MPTMKNPRSLFLQSANPRLLTSPNADVLLSASTPIFHVNNSGVSTPTIITLNASLIALEGTVTFTCEGGTLSNIVGNTCALNYETLTGDNAKVVATITYRNNTYTDTVEISKVYDGQNGVVGMNNAVVYAYQRSAAQPTGTPGAIQYSFSAAAIVTTTLANGWLKTIPAGTSPLWITAASASAAGTTDDIAANEWSSAVVLAQDGANGINSATVTIYKRQTVTTPPELPSVVTTYTFTPAGLTGLNNGWTTTLPPTSEGKYLFASTATAASTSATDTIPVNEWATAQMLAESGSTGARGNVQVARAIPGSIWSDSEAALAISGAGYGTPQSRDIVTLYNNSADYSQQKYYDGSAWQVLAAYFPGGVIVDGTVDATALKAQTITGDKIQAGAITTDKLLVTGKGTCINDDPLLEDVTNCWTLDAGVGLATTGAYTASGAASPRYFQCLSAPDARVKSTRTFPVNPSKTYSATANLWVDAGNNRQVILFLDFYDAGGAQIAGSSTGWGATHSGYTYAGLPPAGVWSRQGGQFGAGVAGRPIPSNAATARIGVWFHYSAAGTGAVIQDAQDIRLELATDAALIVDGAITANKITANSVSAITATIGFMTNRVNGTGQGMELTSNGFTFYDGNNIDRISFGV